MFLCVLLIIDIFKIFQTCREIDPAEKTAGIQAVCIKVITNGEHICNSFYTLLNNIFVSHS